MEKEYERMRKLIAVCNALKDGKDIVDSFSYESVCPTERNIKIGYYT